MTIILNTPVQHTIVEQQQITISTLTIDRIVDLPNEKIVRVFINEVGPIELWVGEAYDAIGQWTDSDVQARLLVLFS